jgi:hypothetical protein
MSIKQTRGGEIEGGKEEGGEGRKGGRGERRKEGGKDI